MADEGQPIGSFGRLVPNYERLSIPDPAWDKHVMAGQIVYIDRFGNLISNLTAYHVKDVRRGHQTVRADRSYRRLTIEGLVRTYAEGVPDQLQALINSNGYVEVFLKEGRAVDRLMAGRGTRVGALLVGHWLHMGSQTEDIHNPSRSRRN